MAAGKPKTLVGVAIALAAVITVGTALYAGMGNVAANAKPQADEFPEDVSAPGDMPEIVQASEFTDENFGEVYEGIAAFAISDVPVDITGQVIGAPWVEDDLATETPLMSFQMYQGKNILDYRYLSASYDLGESPAVTSLDCVHVTGNAAGHRVFTDQHGPFTLPNIVDAKVELLDCIDYLYHAEESIMVGDTKALGGISVTLEKVEFAREHTRAYLSVANGNSEPINFLEGARLAYQGHHHYKHLESALNVHLPEISYTVLPGEVQHGVVLFKPLDYTHDSLFKFAAKKGFDSYVFSFDVPSPFHGGDSDHGEEESHATEEHGPEDEHAATNDPAVEEDSGH
jgi:hypothetical protein